MSHLPFQIIVSLDFLYFCRHGRLQGTNVLAQVRETKPISRIGESSYAFQNLKPTVARNRQQHARYDIRDTYFSIAVNHYQLLRSTFNVQTSNVLKYENESLRQVPAESKSTLVSRNSPRILQNGRKFFFDVLLSDCKAAGRELDCTGILDPCTVCQRSNASAPRVLAHQPRACVLSPSRPRVHPARDPPCRRAAASPLRPGSTHWQTLDGDADSGARRLGGGVAIAPHAQHAAAPQPRADRPRKRPGPSLRRRPCRPTRGHRRPRQADIQRAQQIGRAHV